MTHCAAHLKKKPFTGIGVECTLQRGFKGGLRGLQGGLNGHSLKGNRSARVFTRRCIMEGSATETKSEQTKMKKEQLKQNAITNQKKKLDDRKLKGKNNKLKQNAVTEEKKKKPHEIALWGVLLQGGFKAA